jgi:deazaflavin-dependent oxidoreductase (nitroreductase family)
VSLDRRLKRAVQRFGRLTVNPVAVAMVRSGRRIPAVGRHTVMTLTTVGRKSGKPVTTPMGYVRVDEDTVWAVSEHGARSDWYRNARAAGTVEVQVGETIRSASVRLLPDQDPAAVLRRMNRLVALANRALWHHPAVVEIRLS